MVQFFQQGPSRMGQLSEILGSSLGEGLASFTGNYLANKALEKVLNNPELKKKPLSERLEAMQSGLSKYGNFGQSVLQKRLGIEQQQEQERQQKSLSKVFNKLQKGEELLEEDLKDQPVEVQQQLIKKIQDQKLDNRNYELIKDALGEQVANLWRASPTGAKTEIEKRALAELARKQNLEDQLGQKQPQPNLEPFSTEEEIFPQMETDQLPKDYKYPNFLNAPPGYNQKEWNDERKTWRKENAPIFEENSRRLANTKRDELGTKNLNKINERRNLPEDFSRVFVDPETGDFRYAAKVFGQQSPDAEEWVKEVARFQNRAKDAFGSRVTNFDLASYMKQFPNLMNSYEGRKRILRMMEINYELDKLYQNSLEKIYQKYGLGNIPQEEADRLAKGFIQNKTRKLQDEYLNIDNENQTSSPEIPANSLEGIFG